MYEECEKYRKLVKNKKRTEKSLKKCEMHEECEKQENSYEQYEEM